MKDLLNNVREIPFGEVAIVGFLVLVLALFVAPLPFWLLDALIAFNFVVSLILLITAVQVKNALEFSSFPTLLLFTTVLRLGLTFASTKLILTEAHAAQIIEAFGQLVVGGDIVTGLVVFLILIVVQFLVMTKGAERVAEVGARFTLDAMPGKQMSIDADLRAGLISGDQARSLRSELGRESQLHGAMDGAMKFVKGDAIVGFFIAIICIIGGIIIGTVQHGMTLSEAAQRYTVLTVGEGLVAQLPSLFVAMAAGLLITRVGADESKSSKISSVVTAEIEQHPFSLIASGCIIFLLGLMPGFPLLVFTVVGALPVGLGIMTIRNTRRNAERAGTPMPALRRTGNSEIPVFGQPESAPAFLELRVSRQVRKQVIPTILNVALARARKQLELRVGIPFPGLSVTFVDNSGDDRYEIWSQGAPLTSGSLPPTVRAANANSVIPTDNELVFGHSSHEQWSVEWHLALAVMHVIQKYPHRFIGLQETQTLINANSTQYPDLIAELQREVPVSRISEVLRRLVEEGVSIYPFRDICESLLVWAPRERELTALVELIRIDLGRFIAAQHVDTNGRISGIVLESGTEEVLRESVRQGNLGTYLALSPQGASLFTEKLKGCLDLFADNRQQMPMVLLCSFDIRRHVRRVIEKKFPGLPVLSFQELSGFAEIESASVLEVDLVEA